MTRWPKLWELLTGETYYTPAQRVVLEVWERVKAAEDRGDDRALGRARMELVRAKTDQLRAELNR